MKRPLPFAALCLALVAAPLAAQEGPSPDSAPAPENQVEQGFGLLQEGTRLMLRGLLDQMQPALRDLGAAIDDLNAYEMPEVLPNGDILIRRKHPETPETAPEHPNGAQTDI
jgi:hypothetical protein